MGLKKVSVVTATRAEYGLLRPVIQALLDRNDIDVEVVVTGAHLSPEFGLTYQEIESDNILISKKIEILLSSDSTVGISKAMGLGMLGFADYFEQSQPDLLLVLGDRYETLAVVSCAMVQNIPIAHLYGGETTEGAIDEAIRHAITKMSNLHMTSTEAYKKRVIQLGENPNCVHNVGALGVSNIRKMKLIEKNELGKLLDHSLERPYAIVTYHPVTLEVDQSTAEMEALLKAIDANDQYDYVFTKGNADSCGRALNKMVDAFAAERENCIAVTSLGATKYLSAVKYAKFVLGNSSSGIIEVPSFHIPTINIGNRQKGRIQAESIINCEPDSEAISKAIRKVGDSSILEIIQDIQNPYEQNETIDKIVRYIIAYLHQETLDLKKTFYDIPFTY